MAAHTPGPWRVERFNKSKHSRIQPVGGTAPGGSLADVYDNEADAHLIAAAPDMHEVLRSLDAIGDDLGDPALDGIIAAARWALAKAEGC